MEILKSEFEDAFIEFNPHDVQAVANALITWIERDINPYIPQLIMAGLGVNQEMIFKALVIVSDKLGDERIRQWEERIL